MNLDIYFKPIEKFEIKNNSIGSFCEFKITPVITDVCELPVNATNATIIEIKLYFR